MPKKKMVLGSVKRFGVRYGRTTKYRLAVIEKEQKKPQQCPYCRKPKAHRLSFGIYQCDKCNKKFTGPAYALTPIVVRSEKPAAVEVQETTEEEA